MDAIAPTYPVRTGRLVLRPLDPVADVDAVHAYRSLPEVARYVPFEPQTREDVVARLADTERTRSAFTGAEQAIDLAVVRESDGALVGDVMVMWHSAEHRSGEIGYVIHPDFHGRGYATEAATAALAIAFDLLALHRVVGRVDARNDASAAVLRKVGMRHEATLVDNEWFKGEWSTELSFAILEDEWARLRG